MRSSFLKAARCAALDTVWRFVGQAPPTKVLSFETWLAEGGRGTNHELSPAYRYAYPPRLMRGAVEAIAPTIASLPDPQRGWYQAEWRGGQVIQFNAGRVAAIAEGRLFSNIGLVTTPDDVQLAELSGAAFANLFTHSHYHHGWLPKPRRLRGSAAVLACGVGHRNYYHWISEIMPRLGMLREAGIEPDYYLAPTRHPFHRATLTAAGIDRHRIVAVNKYSHYQADMLYAMPYVHAEMEPRNSDWLYRQMATRPWSATKCQPRRNIYIARRPHDPRYIVNETEILAALQPWKFEKYYLEDLPAREQIKLFQQAEFVIGPHGAGLVNLVFCNAGTRVIEIGSPARPSALFYYIAHNRGLRYCNFYGEAVAQRMDESAIRVDVRALVDCVDEMSAGKCVAAA